MTLGERFSTLLASWTSTLKLDDFGIQISEELMTFLKCKKEETLNILWSKESHIGW